MAGKRTTTTGGIRISIPLYKRMQSIQKQVEAAGSRKPTFTGIIEAWETASDPAEILDTLTKSWGDPGPPQYAEVRAKRKAIKS